jgi:hypothetical protein
MHLSMASSHNFVPESCTPCSSLLTHTSFGDGTHRHRDEAGGSDGEGPRWGALGGGYISFELLRSDARVGVPVADHAVVYIREEFKT